MTIIDAFEFGVQAGLRVVAALLGLALVLALVAGTLWSILIGCMEIQHQITKRIKKNRSHRRSDTQS